MGKGANANFAERRAHRLSCSPIGGGHGSVAMRCIANAPLPTLRIPLRVYTRIGISTYSAAELFLSWIKVGEPGSARRSTATSPSICEAMSIR